MPSPRLGPALAPNALAARVAARARDARPFLDITVSNPTTSGFEYDTDTIVGALSSRSSLQYEPVAEGLATARAGVAAYYASAFGVVVDPRHVLLTASTSEAYTFVFKLLCAPGDRVLVAAPSYPLLDVLARLESVVLDAYPLAYDGAWHIDLADLAARVTPRTRAVVLVHPNNPTGSLVTTAERRALEHLCETRGLALVCDEVFADYVHGSRSERVTTFVQGPRALTFVLSGLSKVCALPQLKLAWIVTAGPEPSATAARDALAFIADAFLSVGAPAQHAAPVVLSARTAIQQQIRTRIAHNLATVRRLAHGSTWSVLHVEAGWYASLRLPAVLDEERWAVTLLDHDDVLVQPGYFFDFPFGPVLVVSLLTPVADFSVGIARLAARVASVAA